MFGFALQRRERPAGRPFGIEVREVRLVAAADAFAWPLRDATGEGSGDAERPGRFGAQLSPP